MLPNEWLCWCFVWLKVEGPAPKSLFSLFLGSTECVEHVKGMKASYVTFAECEKKCKKHRYMDFKARDGRSDNTHYCMCSDICTASPYPAYDIYKNTESANVCPDGFEDSVFDVTDGTFNVKSKGVSTIEACGKLCKNKETCTMFEYKASKKHCKISTGALGTAFQIKKWQSCTKGVSLCLCLRVSSTCSICPFVHTCLFARRRRAPY